MCLLKSPWSPPDAEEKQEFPGFKASDSNNHLRLELSSHLLQELQGNYEYCLRNGTYTFEKCIQHICQQLNLYRGVGGNCLGHSVLNDHWIIACLHRHGDFEFFVAWRTRPFQHN